MTTMQEPLASQRIAILLANGFDERQLTGIQRALVRAGARARTVSPEQGLVNGWHGITWGHCFAVDLLLSETLGSDFDMLLIPGGTRSIARLMQTPHTRRFLGHFIDAGKPISVVGEATHLFAGLSQARGLRLSAPETQHAPLQESGIVIVAEDICQDGAVLSGNGAQVDAWVDATLALFTDIATTPQELPISEAA
ncbi:MAG: DJ-1/PfpI family protein [Alphaproteobacteria bacterium]|nr:MAG: DJ-1/PfpI family protein [Alphaproteobacteria bacterium]